MASGGGTATNIRPSGEPGVYYIEGQTWAVRTRRCLACAREHLHVCSGCLRILAHMRRLAHATRCLSCLVKAAFPRSAWRLTTRLSKRCGAAPDAPLTGQCQMHCRGKIMGRKGRLHCRVAFWEAAVCMLQISGGKLFWEASRYLTQSCCPGVNNCVCTPAPRAPCVTRVCTHTNVCVSRRSTCGHACGHGCAMRLSTSV